MLVSNSLAESADQHIKVELRSIGHEFLLQLNDSTSRVLPIEKIDGRYAIQFEKEFAFEPDLLLFSTYKVLDKSERVDSYIVEVEECGSNKVVHSFEARSKKDDSTACRQRALPRACYVFYYTVIEKGVAKENQYSILLYLFVILILVVGVTVYLKMRKKDSKLRTDLIHIGRYQFDQKAMTLIYDAQPIELSGKEADLLSLLFENESKTLEREYILNVVWGDEGNYIGRTLDVFVSKLRKKLEADQSLKIINVRGVGYRFVIN